MQITSHIKHAGPLVFLFALSTFWVFVPQPILPVGGIFASLRWKKVYPGKVGLVAIALGVVIGYFGIGPYLRYSNEGSISFGLAFGKPREASYAEGQLAWGERLERHEYVGKTFVLTSVNGPGVTAAFPTSTVLDGGVNRVTSLRVTFQSDAIQFISTCTDKDGAGREMESAQVEVTAQARAIDSGYVVARYSEGKKEMKDGVCGYSISVGTYLLRQQNGSIRLYMDPTVYFTLKEENAPDKNASRRTRKSSAPVN